MLQDYLLVYNPSSTKNLTVPLPIRFTNASSLLNRMKDGFTGADPYKLEIKLDGTFNSMDSHTEFNTLSTKLENLGITLTPYFLRNMDSIVIGSRTTSLTTDIFIAEDRDSTTTGPSVFRTSLFIDAAVVACATASARTVLTFFLMVPTDLSQFRSRCSPL